MRRQHTLYFTVQQEDVMARVGIGGERRRSATDIGNREHCKVSFGEVEPLRFGVGDVDRELAKESQDASRLRRAGGVVVAGDEDDLRIGERRTQPAELQKGVDDRRIRRPHVVKDVAADENELGTKCDRLVDRRLKRARDVCLPLVDPTRSQTLVLPESEVEVGEVDETHARGLRFEVEGLRV